MAHTQAAYTSLVVREVGSSSGTQGRPVEVAVVAEVRVEVAEVMGEVVVAGVAAVEL